MSAIGGVYAHDLEGQYRSADRPRRLARDRRRRSARAQPDFPICAIAGINAANAGDVIEAGADGVAVISALSLAADPARGRARICAASSTPRWRSEARA